METGRHVHMLSGHHADMHACTYVGTCAMPTYCRVVMLACIVRAHMSCKDMHKTTLVGDVLHAAIA